MMKPDLNIIRRLLRLLYELFFSIILMEFVMVIFVKKTTGPLYAAILTGLFLVSYIIREHSPNILVMVTFHILYVAVLFLLHTDTEFVMVCGLFAIYLADASYIYIRRNMAVAPVTDFPWFVFLTCFIIYLYGLYTDKLDLLMGVYTIPLCLIFIYLLCVYTDGLAGYMGSAGYLEGIPIKNIVFVNSCVVGSVLILLLVSMLLFVRIDMTVILEGLKSGLAAAFKIIWLAGSFVGAVLSSLITTGTTDISSYGGSYGENIAAQSGKLAGALEALLKLLLVFLLIYMLYRIGRYLLRIMLTACRRETGKAESLSEPVKKYVVREKLPHKKAQRPDAELLFRRTYRGRILRYRYEIDLDRSKTCRDIESQVKKLGMGDISELTELYCDVRYGGRSVDRQLLREIRRLVR